MTPVELVENWVKAFNARDVATLAGFYSADAVNHQVTQEPVRGRSAIRDMFEREFSAANMVCIVDRIHDAGDIVVLEWRDPNGLRGCGVFTVVSSEITLQRGYWDKLSSLKLHGMPIV